MTTIGDKFPRWHKGFEGAVSPFDLGWVHGGEDHWDGKEPKPRPSCVMTKDELEEYKSGYCANWEDGSNLG